MSEHRLYRPRTAVPGAYVRWLIDDGPFNEVTKARIAYGPDAHGPSANYWIGQLCCNIFARVASIRSI